MKRLIKIANLGSSKKQKKSSWESDQEWYRRAEEHNRKSRNYWQKRKEQAQKKYDDLYEKAQAIDRAEYKDIEEQQRKAREKYEDRKKRRAERRERTKTRHEDRATDRAKAKKDRSGGLGGGSGGRGPDRGSEGGGADRGSDRSGEVFRGVMAVPLAAGGLASVIGLNSDKDTRKGRLKRRASKGYLGGAALGAGAGLLSSRITGGDSLDGLNKGLIGANIGGAAGAGGGYIYHSAQENK